MDSIISIKGIRKYFPIRSSSLLRKAKTNKAIDDIDLEIERGEALGIVGESGSGKTTLGKLILGLYRASGGTIEYGSGGEEEINLSVVFQDPFSSSESADDRFRHRQGAAGEPAGREKERELPGQGP